MTQRTSNQENGLPTSKERTRRGHIMVLREILHHGTVETGAWEAAIRYAIHKLELQSPDETSDGWQPIETAPKSKSDAGRDRQYVLVVYPSWKDGKPDPFVLMAYQDNLGWDTGTWRFHEKPTHWMPLPAPPAPSSEKASADAAPLADRLAILGYAPGDYSIKCMDCHEFKTADKRALRCYECAMKRDAQNGGNDCGS